jgi:hypothetical protein
MSWLIIDIIFKALAIEPLYMREPNPTEPAPISVLFVDSFKKIGDIERIGYNGMCGT